MKSKAVGILSVDPGKASGICFLTWSGDTKDNPVVEVSEEVQPEEFAQKVKELMEMGKECEVFRVACERFTITIQTGKNSQAPYSLEQIGVLKHLCRESGIEVESISFQTPVDAKSMFPNPTLQKLGTWHKGGEGHANDAIRHALLCLIKYVKWVPTSLLDW